MRFETTLAGGTLLRRYKRFLADVRLDDGTEVVAHAIADSDGFSIAGGGDTLAAIARFGIESKIGYISTGGGAFLEMLEGKTLPALDILIQRASA